MPASLTNRSYNIRRSAHARQRRNTPMALTTHQATDTTVDPTTFDSTASKSEVYQPSPEVLASVQLPNYLEIREQALKDPLTFWDARAKELVDWFEPYKQIVDDSNAPFFKWFTGGKINIVH